nr:reverse transcriptase domain-containing protein [Tanacetum cinerariifolium]
MTATLTYRDVPNDAIKLMLFSDSLEDRARIWACPHQGFSELTQIDTFYNGLTEQDQNSLNAASGGNLLNKTTREVLQIIENKSKVRYSRSKSNVSRVNTNSRDVVSKTDDRIDKLADQISNLVEIVNKQVITPAKVIEKTCVTCGGAHAYYECIATNSNPSSVCAATGSYNQVFPPNRASHQIPPPGFASVQNNPNRRNLNDDMRNILSSFFQNQPSTSGTLPSNTILNLKGEMKAVTTCSGLAYEGPSIPTESPLEKVDEQNTEEILDKEYSNSSGSTTQVQPPVVPISISEPDVLRNQTKPSIPYPSRDGVMKYSDNSVSRVNVINIASEEVVQDNTKSSNPTLVSESDFCEDPIVKTSPFRESDFFSEEIENFLNDDSIPTGIKKFVYDPEGDILYFENLVKEDPFQLPLMNLNQAKSPIEEPEYLFSMGLMERLITINLCPRPIENAYTIVESLPSSLIPIQDNDSQREEIDIVTDTDGLLPPGFKNDDLEGEIDVVEELRVDNSIPNSKNELSDNEASNHDNPSFPRPPSEPPDAEFDFEPDAGEEISVVMNNNDELECLDPGGEFDISTNDEDDDYFPFTLVIYIFLPYLIYSEVFLLLISAESETPFLTLASLFRAGGISLGWNFLMLLCLSKH